MIGQDPTFGCIVLQYLDVIGWCHPSQCHLAAASQIAVQQLHVRKPCEKTGQVRVTAIRRISSVFPPPTEPSRRGRRAKHGTTPGSLTCDSLIVTFFEMLRISHCCLHIHGLSLLVQCSADLAPLVCWKVFSKPVFGAYLTFL